jgi:hypothetical protein
MGITLGATHGSGVGSVYDGTLNPAYMAGVWGDCPLFQAYFDHKILFDYNERFDKYDAAATDGDWVLTQATTGAAAISAAAPGVLELDSNSTTSTQGANLQNKKVAIIPAAGKDTWAEFRIKIVDTFDFVELFVGLAESDTTIIAASAVSTANHIGWQCVTDNGVLLFDCEKASAATTIAAATIAEATYINLGFKVTGVTSIQQYINGVATGALIATANIPIVALYPSFVCQSAGTNDPIMHIDGCRIVQMR